MVCRVDVRLRVSCPLEYCSPTRPCSGAFAVTAHFSLRDAARLYDLSLSTLGRRIRNGEIEAFKSEGADRGEWRVTAKALEAFGYQRRPEPAPKDDTYDPRTIRKLERELAATRREAEAQRRRADRADRELGEALMEAARLRAALAAETSRRVHAELLRDQTTDRGVPPPQ